MKTTGQNSSSWFRKNRVAAGYEKVTLLATQFGVPKGTLQKWDGGIHPPRRRHLPKIAELFGVELTEAVKGLWGETLGDPCACGCGGKNVLPDSGTAHHLYIELPCAKCGTKRVYRTQSVSSGNLHSRLCRRCEYVGRRFERIEFTCVGYRDHDRLKRHAPKCPKKKAMIASRIRYYRSIKKENPTSPQPPFLDEVSRKFRCKPCSSAALAIMSTERRLTRHAKRFGSAEPIRSQKQRRELLSTYHSDLNRGFVRKLPQALQAAKTAHPRGESPNRVRGLVARAWSRGKLPRWTEIHRCVFCRKLTLTTRRRTDMRFHYHKGCYAAWCATPEGLRYSRGLRYGEPRMIHPQKGRGRPLAEKNLKTYFAWAIQHYFGAKSFRAIAEENDKDFGFVGRQIQFVVENLPAPELVSRHFRPRVKLLLDAAGKH